MAIKLLIGGSLCTYWSIAQSSDKREVVAEGIGWELFENYLIAKEKFKPDLFLYENNKSAAQAIKDQIANELGVGVDPQVRFTYINSSLVSAQNRERFYVTNFGDISQPEDRNIFLRDIIEGCTDRDKARTVISSIGRTTTREYFQKAQNTMVFEPVLYQYPHGKNNGGIKYEKSPTLTARGAWQENNKVFEPVNPLKSGKARCITAGYSKKGSKHILESNYSENPAKQTWDSIAEPVGDQVGFAIAVEWNDNGEPITARSNTDGKIYPVHKIENGLITIKGKKHKIALTDGYYIIRKLTVKECARLQTMPDNYCKAVSPSQAYKALGNGWTAEIIIHLLNHALKDVPSNEEIIVLSLYDGIATGRYCLEQMGFTNITYHAYEIDPYPIKIAMDNYPSIIQYGDAFAVRNEDWKPPQTKWEWLDELLGSDTS